MTGLGLVDLGFLAIVSVPVLVMNARGRPATNLAALTATADVSIETASSALRHVFGREPQRTERAGAC